MKFLKIYSYPYRKFVISLSKVYGGEWKNPSISVYGFRINKASIWNCDHFFILKDKFIIHFSCFTGTYRLNHMLWNEKLPSFLSVCLFLFFFCNLFSFIMRGRDRNIVFEKTKRLDLGGNFEVLCSIAAQYYFCSCYIFQGILLVF